MEDEVCHFQKFGYCKFQERCKRKHFTQVCDSLSRCKDKDKCQKRHPKNCKRFASETGCRHKEGCAYSHNVPNQFDEDNEVNEKVSRLEKMVDELTKKVFNQETEKVKELDKIVKVLVRKVLSLESDITEMKKNKIASEGIEGEVVNKTTEGAVIKENKIHVKSDLSDENCFNPSSCSSPKVKSDKTKKVEKKEEFFKCEKCDYKVKKEATLKKHIITKHEVNVCKECNEKVSTFMELLKHVAKNHTKETVEETQFKEPDEKGFENKDVEVIQGDK